MKKSLYIKLSLAYVTFGVLSFLFIAFFALRMTYSYLVRNEAESLYAIVYMRAPYGEGFGDLVAADAHAYNNIYMTFEGPHLYILILHNNI